MDKFRLCGPEDRVMVFELKGLFDSVGAEGDTSPGTLMTAYERASHKACVRETETGKLVGFARSMDDGAWNANVDCVVVHRDYQGQGVGTMLISDLLEQLKDVMCVCVSPDCFESAAFYERFGFDKSETGCLMKRIR